VEETMMDTGPTLSITRVKPPKQFAQLGVLVVDGSGSMEDPADRGGISKAQATNKAIRELFTRFKTSKVANNFTFAVVTFDDVAKVRLAPTDVGDSLNDNDDYDPLKEHGHGTRIYTALAAAETMANDFLSAAPAGGVPHSVIILVMSDGVCSDPSRTREAADRIRKGPNADRVKIVCAYFSSIANRDPAGPDLLQQIASDPVMGYKTVYDADTLRDFFNASMSAAAGVQDR
jgi:Mg-chelatase subunit ChlD